jgi:uncharacterized protein (DUF427 family)
MPNPAPGFAAKPTHRVDLVPEPRRVRVVFAGTVIADSAHTLRVEETGHEAVHYFPEADVRVDLLRATQNKTHCPFKGDASYWTIVAGDGGAAKQAENAVWAYKQPFDEMAGLTGHYAFYKSRVDSVTVA